MMRAFRKRGDHTNDNDGCNNLDVRTKKNRKANGDRKNKDHQNGKQVIRENFLKEI